MGHATRRRILAVASAAAAWDEGHGPWGRSQTRVLMSSPLLLFALCDNLPDTLKSSAVGKPGKAMMVRPGWRRFGGGWRQEMA